MGACGASMIKPLQPRSWREENQTTALTGAGNAPLLPPTAASPPEGEILAVRCLEQLIEQDNKRRANFPLRGQVPRSGDRGAFPTGAAWFACFPYRALVRLYGFIIRGALYDLKGACHLPRSGEKNQKLTPLSYGATPFLGKGALYCGASRHHNPHAEGVSNLRTLGPAGPSILRTFSSEPFRTF